MNLLYLAHFSMIFIPHETILLLNIALNFYMWTWSMLFTSTIALYLLTETNSSMNFTGQTTSEPGLVADGNDTNTTRTNSSRECNDGFYLNEVGICRPQCGRWQVLSSAVDTTLQVLQLIGVCIGIACGAGFLIISFLQWRTM